MKFKQKRDLILNGNMTKVIITLALPIMLNNFIQTIYNLTDTFWVSKLGETEVAAMTLIWPIIFFMMSLGMGVAIAGTALISQYTGSNDLEDATEVAGQVISFTFIASLVLGVIGYFLTPYIVKAMGGEGELYNRAVEFLSLMLLGLPTMFVFFGFNSIKQGQGDTVSPMIYGGLSVALNIILDPILILYFDLGIRGAAIATITARGIFALYAVYRLFLSNEGIRLHKRHLAWNKKVLTKLIKVAWPSSLGQSTSALGFAILNIFIISFGQSTMAAFGIGNRINSLILMPAMGIGNALATIVGQNLGANNLHRAKKAVKTSAILSTVVLVIGGSIIFMISESVIGLFTKDPDVLSQGTFYLKLIVTAIPLMGFFQIFIGTFQGSGHTIMAMIIMMGRLWAVRIPLIIIFKNYTNLGANSVWYAMILSNAVICLVGLGLYMTGRWETKVVKKRAI
ncbi:MATE family efflux transporter [Sporosalibacterium faouarense]|uniref:MATE family efflux transporter n=1 Tax=Sporosalibacterium faouarense TaxID=516123 RepID=UPI00141C98C4|nr:MATE family efflux transporter [Sporosalibacterium faouarense]MTI46434.1 MATE family efflux transporter [Bacillota bacterium]